MLSKLINTICLPIRFILSHEAVNKLGLRSLRDERCNIVMKYCRGRLLDIGCGNNQLVRAYGHDGVGVDVYDFAGEALIVEDSSKLPFEDGSFQTVSFVASLNHIPNRQQTLKEVYRILSEEGLVLVTAIIPFVGIIRHKLAWWDPDQHKRDMKEGEEMGLTHEYIVCLLENEGFEYVKKKRFILGLNNLYIFKRKHLSNSKGK